MPLAELGVGQRCATARDRAHSTSRRLLEAPDRHAEDRTRRGAQRLRRRSGRRSRRRARRRRRRRRRSGSACRRCPGRPRARAPERPAAARRPAGRPRRKTPITRGGCGSVEMPASRSGSTDSPATSRSTGSIPAPSAASTRSSPSQTNRPSFVRCRLLSSRRTSLSRGLAAEVITAALYGAEPPCPRRRSPTAVTRAVSRDSPQPHGGATAAQPARSRLWTERYRDCPWDRANGHARHGQARRRPPNPRTLI